MIGLTLQSFSRREHKMHTIAHAIQELVDDPRTQNKAICFLSYPMDGLGDQPADIVRVMRHSLTLPVFCDTATALVQEGAHIIITQCWYNAISPYYTKNYVTITPVGNGFRYQSSDPSKMHFFISDTHGFSLGKKVINEKQKLAGRDVVTGFTLVIDQKYLDYNPAFAVWNYQKPGFDILN